MLILDDDRLESLRCSKCRKYLSVFPVKNHPTSRDVTCGRCSRDDDGGVRSFLYELVAVEYLFRCVNRYEGCGKVLRVDETEAHEQLCVGGTFPCLKCEDGAEMSALELMWHYKIEHPSSFLRRKNRFDARPQAVDVKLYARDDIFAFVSVRYGADALRLAAATLTEVGTTQEFSVSRGERLWERTERRPCKAIGAYDAERYVVDIDPPVSVEVTFDLEASRCAGMYDVSVLRSSKGAMADKFNRKMLRVHWSLSTGVGVMFGYKLNDLGTALLNSDGDEIDLNCSNCKRLIGLPIYRCQESNHQICYGCRAWCGICDSQVTQCYSDSPLETISKHLKFPCKWMCGTYLTYNLRAHELFCGSRMFKCRLCSFVVDWSNLTLIKDHLEADHGILNFLGDYDQELRILRLIEKFVGQSQNGELSFVRNDECCYLKWSQNDSGLYDFYFGVYGNEPNIRMAWIQGTCCRKQLNGIRRELFNSGNFIPYINFNHKTIVTFPRTASPSTRPTCPERASPTTPVTFRRTASPSTRLTCSVTTSPPTLLTFPVTASPPTPVTVSSLTGLATTSSTIPLTFPGTASSSIRLTSPVTASPSTRVTRQSSSRNRLHRRQYVVAHRRLRSSDASRTGKLNP